MEDKLNTQEENKYSVEKKTDVKEQEIPKFFLYIPKIVTIIFAVFFFVFGIVAHVYGEKVINIELPLVVWWIIGVGFCTIIYFFLKLVFSRKVLQFYLSKRILK